MNISVLLFQDYIKCEETELVLSEDKLLEPLTDEPQVREDGDLKHEADSTTPIRQVELISNKLTLV